MLDVQMIPILSDNYCYILTSGDDCAVLDPGEADQVIKVLDDKGLTPNIIFNTHHHPDHVAGNAKIKERYGAKIIGPTAEADKILGLDIEIDETSDLSFGGEKIQLIETPGHTAGHICFYFPDSKTLFAGDTLFAMGCGRLFEGTPQEMWASFQKLKALPTETTVYCGHEYTLANGKFCEHAAPNNEKIKERMREVRVLRDNNQPTIPTTLEQEHHTNVFMLANTADEFAALRAAKDNF